jgi:hypothetical protein
MTITTREQFIADITYDVIVQMAPDELPLFNAVREAYFKHPEKITKGRGDKEEILGFGIGEVLPLVSPIALAVVSAAVGCIADTIKQSSSEALKRAFKKFRYAQDDTKHVLPVLTREQMAEVHRVAVAKARQLKLSEAQAKRLADAVVSQLATVDTE